jgi:hypothetical protein
VNVGKKIRKVCLSHCRLTVALTRSAHSSSLCYAPSIFAILYVKVTGPYWDLSTSQKVSYVSLLEHVQHMAQQIDQWIAHPAGILKDEEPISAQFPPNKESPLSDAATRQPADMQMFQRTLTCLLEGIKNCISCQLKQENKTTTVISI